MIARSPSVAERIVPEALRTIGNGSKNERAVDSTVLPEGAHADDDRSFLPILRAAIDHTPSEVTIDLGGSGEMDLTWIRVRGTHFLPEQGWKLHVSAGIHNAEAVLRRTLPVLLGEGATFKFAATSGKLASLNQGTFGPTQVGKCITVYPVNDMQAVRLARTLDQVTRGLRGPLVPTDRPLRPGSLVHYRFGGFSSRLMQMPNGEIVPTITAPDGARQPDMRLQGFSMPEWAVDPFVTPGDQGVREQEVRLIAGKYMQITPLHRSAKGAVWLAVDIPGMRRCVLKQSTADDMLGTQGQTSYFLRRERDLLGYLAADPRFPRVYDLVEEEGNLYLVLEDLAGVSLERRIFDHIGRSSGIPNRDITCWGRSLAESLSAMHERGLVHRDLKPSNVMISSSGEARLIDLELAYGPAFAGLPLGRGTRGYISPRQDRLETPEPSDDIYSLGAVLYFAATLADPALAPNPYSLLDRSPAMLNPAIDPVLGTVIARCLDPDPAHRYQSAAEVARALGTLSIGPISTRQPSTKVGGGTETMGHDRAGFLTEARRLGDTLCRVARPLPGSEGKVWHSSHHFGGGVPGRDLGSGTAGVVLALADLAPAFDCPEHWATLSAGARGLIDIPRLEGAPLAGLMVGEAGVGAALLQAGRTLRDSTLVETAAAWGGRVGALPFASPDFFNGTAGRLLFHLLLWDHTNDREHLDHARAAGDWLVQTAVHDEDGTIHWPFPPRYGGLGKGKYLGYAHGAAGIADSLLDLFEATGEERFSTLAIRAARGLAGQATPAEDDETCLTWPGLAGEKPVAPFWCHGAAGIGRLFLHAARLGLMPEAEMIADGAAHAVARHARWANPTQCHGLSGNIEFLLDCYQTSGKEAWLIEAHSLGRLLQAFAVERKGNLYYPSEFATTCTPDYMTGFAGVAVCLLRLGEPEHRPRQLSREGFRFISAIEKPAVRRDVGT